MAVTIREVNTDRRRVVALLVIAPVCALVAVLLSDPIGEWLWLAALIAAAVIGGLLNARDGLVPAAGMALATLFTTAAFVPFALLVALIIYAIGSLFV